MFNATTNTMRGGTANNRAKAGQGIALDGRISSTAGHKGQSREAIFRRTNAFWDSVGGALGENAFDRVQIRTNDLVTGKRSSAQNAPFQCTLLVSIPLGCVATIMIMERSTLRNIRSTCTPVTAARCWMGFALR